MSLRAYTFLRTFVSPPSLATPSLPLRKEKGANWEPNHIYALTHVVACTVNDYPNEKVFLEKLRETIPPL
ncbi:hypothetical protein POVWA2_028730 [Plasmodium ovale wallikeri]|uniref:Uncharacterized protein n=1 Tax=Plasmodium ovale wallikeri TaxID=864142 RepID=A0A1A8YX86_PLAOA|nr:hypothetical protein POVWA1_028890 [Plasmodium ovale wallikeri]SBT36147.1 hypothetical protein POVWA2_028730 [Plasmodium ovale wallikeri]